LGPSASTNRPFARTKSARPETLRNSIQKEKTMNIQSCKNNPKLNDLDREVLKAVGDSEVFDPNGYPLTPVVDKIAKELNRGVTEVYYSLKAIRTLCPLTPTF
jgi:hypothetical protein